MANLILIIMSFISTAYAGKEECEFSIGSCAYYSCLSEELHCNTKEYPLAFGLHYCEKFDHQENEYSELGKIFLKKIKACLQEQLQEVSDLTCKKADDLSPGHHLICYRRENYCALPTKDKILISGTTLKKMIEDERFRKTARKIMNCPSSPRL